MRVITVVFIALFIALFISKCKYIEDQQAKEDAKKYKMLKDALKEVISGCVYKD